jgi:hypothetical protein
MRHQIEEHSIRLKQIHTDYRAIWAWVIHLLIVVSDLRDGCLDEMTLLHPARNLQPPYPRCRQSKSSSTFVDQDEVIYIRRSRRDLKE